MRYIYIGKIVNTHGIKGELRILSDFKYKKKIFKHDTKIYISNEKTEETINTYRPHKQFDMITLVGYNNINEVLKYKGQKVYIKDTDIKLEENEYLDEDIIGLTVIYNNKEVGYIKKIEKYPHQDLIVVKRMQKEYLIPYISDIIESISLQEKKIIIKNIKGLIE